MFKSNKKIDSYIKRKLTVNDETRIGLSKNYNSLPVKVRGYKNLMFIKNDDRNYIAKISQFRFRAENAKIFSNIISRMEKWNSNFFYEIDIDEEGQLRNLFRLIEDL